MPEEEHWDVLGSEQLIEHPYLHVTLQQVRLPDGRVVPDWHIVQTRDYVNLLALNEVGEAMVLIGYKHGIGRSSWQVVGGYLEEGEEPLATAQRELLEETGYASDDWHHLGTYVMDANRHVGTGHFYIARSVRQVTQPHHDDLEGFEIRWVPLSDLRAALTDGRVAGISYAMNIALGLLVVGC